MKSLVLMYVFYDKNGDIKAITPSPSDVFSDIFSVATFPLQEVEMFLTAQKNTFDYQIRCIEKDTGTTCKLIKKNLIINYTRTLNSYLTKVDDNTSKPNIITIVNDISNKVISLRLSEDFKSSDEEDILNFIKQGPSILYLTKKNNPYWLLSSFTFTPVELFEREILYFECENKYNDTSIYTKKLINSYGYKEKV